ncbi:hypothetical protein JQ634_07810 [Bradyrhizobium sp. AUGA SZCCT0240]|uniref:hypothetical protein n=1 Tax=unclassified Bradyrhizobium TaxID=2631580 RepID=UPI001BAC6D81|nr:MULTISPECIES: hypothetical protein [unclassified Bradyrhizobium]MBR1192629.1 hypothetical protein [Bradyrhizobium sp. AUGA SZCCT0160]MBR1199114.1 hypothetical protein [Bradyrhizobium sp. AUGA SZCCT0158]MBR1238700.1 hypothetical protein [Bradyrhizobium sp. AUGA SZCCT0274]MBR1253604.1 hypothetical protein [Bradyrhizobium sp. AUGA SZCCT0240]
MDISAVSAPVQIKPPEASAPKTDLKLTEVKPADVQNGAAADGTRLPKPTLLAALPPGQGTRVDQLA